VEVGGQEGRFVATTGNLVSWRGAN
jgi:hypothetical protein